jgi:hypothetical protein
MQTQQGAQPVLCGSFLAVGHNQKAKKIIIEKMEE